MKITKQQLKQMVQEEVDNSKLEKLLIQKKVKIKGWELEVERMSGSWGWHNPKFPDCVIYATLGWDGEEVIPIQVNDPDGENVFMKTFKYKPTGQLMTDLQVYLKTVKKWIPTIEGKLKKLQEVDEAKEQHQTFKFDDNRNAEGFAQEVENSGLALVKVKGDTVTIDTSKIRKARTHKAIAKILAKFKGRLDFQITIGEETQ
jgi:hypothetical protein